MDRLLVCHGAVVVNTQLGAPDVVCAVDGVDGALVVVAVDNTSAAGGIFVGLVGSVVGAVADAHDSVAVAVGIPTWDIRMCTFSL